MRSEREREKGLVNRHIATLVPGALAFLVVLAAIILLFVERGAPPAHGDPPPPPPFTVLDDGAQASLGLVDLVPTDWVTDYGLDLEEAVSAESASSVEVAVIPGSAGVCIVTETAGGCASWLDAELGQLALIESCSPDLDPGEVRVTGLVPDDASTAVITRPPAAGVNVSAPLNVYAETFSGDPEELASTGLNVPAVLPWDASDESLTACQVPDEEEVVDGDEE